MIVAYLDVVGITGDESKANSPLVVDGDRVLPFSVARKRMETIAARNLQIIQPFCKVHVFKLARCSLRKLRRKSFGLTGNIQILRAPVRERLDHSFDCNVSRDECQISVVKPLRHWRAARTPSTCPCTQAHEKRRSALGSCSPTARPASNCFSVPICSRGSFPREPLFDDRPQRPSNALIESSVRISLRNRRAYETMSLSFFNGRIFTTLRAGLALNIVFSPVKGLMPSRSFVAGLC